MRYPTVCGLLIVGVVSATIARAQSAPKDLGILVMAHGGSDEWNAGVLSAVEPLRAEYDIKVAFGMADALTLHEAVSRVEEAGAEQIAVVRLFVSGDSWFERTEQILGIVDGAPERPKPPLVAGQAGHQQHSMEFWRIDTDASFEMSIEGLAEAPEMGAVVAERARALSRDPAREDVVLLAHGPEDDEENRRWLEHMEMHADQVRDALPFHAVAVETLREDWPEKRADAVQRIRAFVFEASANRRRALVIPFRVHGFGPYEDVLEGLEYVSDGLGLVPHRFVTDWIERQIEFLSQRATNEYGAGPLSSEGTGSAIIRQ